MNILKEIKLTIQCSLLLRALLFVALPLALAVIFYVAPESSGMTPILEVISTWLRNAACFFISLSAGVWAVYSTMNPRKLQLANIKNFSDAFNVGSVGKKSKALAIYHLASALTLSVVISGIFMNYFYYDMTSPELVKYLIVFEFVFIANMGLLATLFEVVLDGVNKVLVKTNKNWYLTPSEIIKASSYGATIEIFTPTEEDKYCYSIVKFLDDDTTKVIKKNEHCTRC
jgi:hypothetical protein